MAITKSTELSNAGKYPSRRHNERERKLLETAESYTPADSTDWTGLAGSPLAPTTQDQGLDTLASVLSVVDVQEVSGTLSSAELLAMNATPVVAIAAPGAGKIIVPEEIELFLDYNSAAYAADAGEDLVCRYTTSGTAVATWDDADTIIEGSADERRLHKLTYAATFDPDVGDNESLEFAILSGEWADGDSPIMYRIRYRIVTLLA